MNVFKSLDALFPTGVNRTFGEVVNVDITVSGLLIEEATGDAKRNQWALLSMKRKAWYVNASVNAFHMHRHLVRELMNTNVRNLSRPLQRRAKRLVAIAVLTAYLDSHKHGRQYNEFSMNFHTICDGFDVKSIDVYTAWKSHELFDGTVVWRELVDSGLDLQTSVDIAVVQARMQEQAKA